MSLRFIKVVFHIFTITGAKNIVLLTLYRGLRHKETRYIKVLLFRELIILG